jgi:hypothetical protein
MKLERYKKIGTNILNRTHKQQQPVVLVDCVNLLGENINAIKQNTETLTDNRGETGLKGNAETTTVPYPVQKGC